MEELKLEALMDAQEEEVVALYLRNVLKCSDESFHLMMEECKRLFTIIYQHDNKKKLIVDRDKIIESLMYTAENMIKNELSSYPWIIAKLHPRDVIDNKPS